MRKLSYLLLVSTFSTTIVEKIVFQPVQTKVNIQEKPSFIIK